MKVKTDYDKCDYITAGKEYYAEPHALEGLAVIVADNHKLAVIMLNRTCPHLHEIGTWEVVE